jgi:hypothetical protein
MPDKTIDEIKPNSRIVTAGQTRTAIRQITPMKFNRENLEDKIKN